MTASSVRFEIIFADSVSEHLATIDRKDHSLILDTIEQQLTHEPAAPTRNRKALRIPNMVNATWELRCGTKNRYRIFYDVQAEDHYVVVLAIGSKDNNKLTIGRQEFEL
jgi:mRNA-degrading endonuclease RelE of RelBE toxin-antitoxin system